MVVSQFVLSTSCFVSTKPRLYYSYQIFHTSKRSYLNHLPSSLSNKCLLLTIFYKNLLISKCNNILLSIGIYIANFVFIVLIPILSSLLPRYYIVVVTVISWYEESL